MKTLLCIVIGAAAWAYLVALAFSAPAADLGGNVGRYIDAFAGDVRPIEGVCASACTVRLSSAKCVDRRAILGFHAARVDGDRSDLATLRLATYYNVALRRWFYAGDLSIVRWLHGVDLAQFGYKVCGR